MTYGINFIMETEILTINSPEDNEQIDKAAALLDNGSLVAFPTETVYGVGCKVSLSSIERLNVLKGRHPEKYYTLHVGNLDQIMAFLPSLNLQARKLIQKGLPGPMTVVFDVDPKALAIIQKLHSKEIVDLLCPDRTLGIRYPANAVACAILSRAKSPVVAPSANPAGQVPATTADETMRYFNGQIDCIVDAQQSGCLYKQSSSVVNVGRQGIQILRQGAVPEEKIREWSKIRILFVCTGNTCRSPMAEGCCKKYFCDIFGCQVDELDDFGYIINSAGVAAFEDVPASGNAMLVCQDQKIDLSGHRSRQVTRQEIEQSDLIFTMSQSHRASIIQLLPSASEKCFTLDSKSDISDPVGMGVDVYRNCFSQIKDNILKKMDGII